MRMSNVKFTHKKQFPIKRSYQHKKTLSNITAHCQHSYPALIAHTLFLVKAKDLEEKINIWFQKDCKIKIKKNFKCKSKITHRIGEGE